MINKIVAPLLLMLILLSGCLKDPDPLPETIDTYQNYYNYFLESYAIQWDIDDEILGTGHAYGIPAEAIIILDQAEQELLIQALDSDSGLLLDSLSYTMFENGAYMTAILGSEEEPHLLCEPINTRPPATGMIKFRFLHASPDMGPVDIYIGGDLPEHKVLSSVDYTSVTEYSEATEEQLWEAIIVTPADSLPADSSILSYTVNTIFRSGWSYICAIAHSSSSIESSYQILVDDQPIY
ncbi:MAG: hypothetical protein DRJ29_09480 [Bacteroidetes bacterium]|nr:MAG: hypothetical protein DRJ29_09480 [Bacteroidota bacterium]